MKNFLTNISKETDLTEIQKIEGVEIKPAFNLDGTKPVPRCIAIWCYDKDRAKILNILHPTTFPL